jgi:cardiolipin synthase
LLKKQDVQTALFLPPSLIPPAIHINLRNHRKILTVDGETAFTGGMNIGDRHLAAAEDNPSRVKDIHFQFSGPVVHQIEAMFLEGWNFSTRQEEDPPSVPGGAPRAGDAICRAIIDGPGEDFGRLAKILVGAVSAAHHEILIMNPYFLPSREMIGALQAAALRGVEVIVLLPAKSNLPFVDWATRNMLWEILQWGIRVYYQPPPFVHSKLFVVDGCYAQVGSANLDSRSLRLNFELAIEIFDSKIAGQMAEFGRSCRAQSKEISIMDVDGRTIPIKVRDALAWLFSPYL